MKDLLLSIKSVRSKIVEPYDDIERQCNILTRLHDTSNILRCVIQVQQLAKIIEKHDNLKASALIREVGKEIFIFLFSTVLDYRELNVYDFSCQMNFVKI